MKLINDSFDNEFPPSVGTLLNLQKSAISYLLSDPRLQLFKLNEEEYMEGLIAYYSQDDEKEIMLETTLQAIEEKKYSQDSYSILSLGCGTGIFEKPFLENLLNKTKIKINFVGVEPNQIECAITQEWCKKNYISRPNRFDFKIHPVSFENFKSSQKFDIILLIHSLYNFSELEISILKIYQLLKNKGIGIIAIEPKRQLLNEPVYHVYRKLYNKTPNYSEDVEKILSQYNLPFSSETINCSVNITECFKPESKFGKLLLDFIILANTAYFSPLQLQLLLDYFASGSHKMETGEVMLPHSVDLFSFKKE